MRSKRSRKGMQRTRRRTPKRQRKTRPRTQARRRRTKREVSKRRKTRLHMKCGSGWSSSDEEQPANRPRYADPPPESTPPPPFGTPQKSESLRPDVVKRPLSGDTTVVFYVGGAGSHPPLTDPHRQEGHIHFLTKDLEWCVQTYAVDTVNNLYKYEIPNNKITSGSGLTTLLDNYMRDKPENKESFSKAFITPEELNIREGESRIYLRISNSAHDDRVALRQLKAYIDDKNLGISVIDCLGIHKGFHQGVRGGEVIILDDSLNTTSPEIYEYNRADKTYHRKSAE